MLTSAALVPLRFMLATEIRHLALIALSWKVGSHSTTDIGVIPIA